MIWWFVNIIGWVFSALASFVLVVLNYPVDYLFFLLGISPTLPTVVTQAASDFWGLCDTVCHASMVQQYCLDYVEFRMMFLAGRIVWFIVRAVIHWVGGAIT